MRRGVLVRLAYRVHYDHPRQEAQHRGGEEAQHWFRQEAREHGRGDGAGHVPHEEPREEVRMRVEGR